MKISRTTFLIVITIFLIGVTHPQPIEDLSQSRSRAETVNKQAVRKVVEGNLPEAIRLFQDAIEILPNYAIAYDNLGASFYSVGRLEDAAAALRRSIQIDPYLASAHGRLGVVYVDLGKYAEGVEAFRRSIELKPDSAIAHYNLGCGLVHLEKFKEAVSSFRTAETLDPNHFETYVQSSYALGRLKAFTEAIRLMEKAVALRPDDMEGRLFLGYLYLLGGDRRSALLQYRRIALVDSVSASKFYSVIYSRMLVSLKEK